MAVKLFEKGNPGGPGRHKGSRTIAIEIIYKAFNECGAKKFESQMRELAAKNPVAYYLKFIQPIQPRDISFSEDSMKGKRIIIEDAC
jgi:hypothetical protein